MRNDVARLIPNANLRNLPRFGKPRTAEFDPEPDSAPHALAGVLAWGKTFESPYGDGEPTGTAGRPRRVLSAFGISESGSEQNRFAWALVACAALLALPLWFAAMPAMPDYPAHLATFYLLSGGAKSPVLAQFYRVHWTAVPNLAGEALIPLLGAWIGLRAATAVFLTFAVVAWSLSGAAIQWALFRRITPAPLLGSAFVYNANFMWGFFNYCFGTALALLVFAGWIMAERQRRPWLLACFSLVTLVIYFCHVFAAAMLLLLVFCYEFSAISRQTPFAENLRRLGLPLVIAIPAAVAFLFFKPAGAGGSVEFNIIDTILDRLSSPMQFAFDRPAWLLLAALTALVVYGLWTGRIGLHPRMKPLLLVLVVLCIFMPEWAMGGWGVDLRVPALFGTLAFASAEFRFERRVQLALAGAAVLLAGWQSATLSGNWRYYGHRFAEFRTANRLIRPGSKIVTVLDGDSIGLASDQPYWHMAEYAIIDRGVFTPLLFTTRGQHVIELTPAVAGIAAASAQQGSPPDISELDDLAAGNSRDDKDIREVFPYLLRFQCRFDVAVVIHLAGHRSPVPDTLAPMHEGSFFSLYKIRRDENCASK